MGMFEIGDAGKVGNNDCVIALHDIFVTENVLKTTELYCNFLSVT